MSLHSYGLLSIVPPLVTIGLAVTTRRVVISLMAGVIISGFVLAQGNPLQAIVIILERQLWQNLVDSDHLRVFTFTLLMGGLVGVIQETGGMREVVRMLLPWVRSRRGGQVVAWILGLIIFFDDYANTLLLGTTMRPLADRLRISREKLAYIVDSTAAPVAGIAILSTWAAVEIGYIAAGLEGLEFSQDQPSVLTLFFATIPYRFYILWALLLVGLIAVTGRDFGAMYHVERGELSQVTIGTHEKICQLDSVRNAWANAVLPIVAVLITMVCLLLSTGRSNLSGDEPASWFKMLAAGDSYISLMYASLAGLAVAVLLARFRGGLLPADISRGAVDGARKMLPALLILWLAWTLSAMTGADQLGTGAYLARLVSDDVPIQFMPTLVYLLASLIAFATGTSWGTMGLLMPMAIQTIYSMLVVDGSSVAADNPILLATIASVLAGAIFGDHCSPISDTTVLSSQAAGCEHMAHVITQLPYAILASLVAVICGTVPVGYGISVWIALPVGLVMLVGCTLCLARRVENGEVKT